MRDKTSPLFSVRPALEEEVAPEPRDGFEVLALDALHGDVARVPRLGAADLHRDLLSAGKAQRVRHLRVPVRIGRFSRRIGRFSRGIGGISW